MDFWLDNAAKLDAMWLLDDEQKDARNLPSSQYASKENKANYKPIWPSFQNWEGSA